LIPPRTTEGRIAAITNFQNKTKASIRSRLSFNKKFVCIFLIVFTLIGLSAVALQNALGSQGFPVDSNPVSTE
jgi:hypothetical protein